MACRADRGGQRRLVFQLLELGLVVGDDGPRSSSCPARPATVVTGHHHGVITLNLAESTTPTASGCAASWRARTARSSGTSATKIGHYYWELLIPGTGSVTEWRELFGDEGSDYESALERHYDVGRHRHGSSGT